MNRVRLNRHIVVLTGGPGGGKTTLIQELVRDSGWSERFVMLPEAIWVAGQTGISPRERSFQELMVEMQAAMEEALDRTLGAQDRRAILCHRGALDPLAYWLDRGWPEDEFFALTHTTYEDYYMRYTAVLHLVTAADGAVEHYRSWPDAHRGETPEQAIRLDKLLEHAWSSHKRFLKIGNDGMDWPAKSRAVRQIIQREIGSA